MVHLGLRDLHFKLALWLTTLDSPPGEALDRQIFTLCWNVLRMKVQKGAWGFFFLLSPHGSGHAWTLNVTVTFALIPAFSSPGQFSFNPSYPPSFHSLSILSTLTQSDTVLELNSTPLFHFHLLAQGLYCQIIGKHFAAASRLLQFRLLLSTTHQAAVSNQQVSAGAVLSQKCLSSSCITFWHWLKSSEHDWVPSEPLQLGDRWGCISGHLLNSLCLSNSSPTLLPEWSHIKIWLCHTCALAWAFTSPDCTPLPHGKAWYSSLFMPYYSLFCHTNPVSEGLGSRAVRNSMARALSRCVTHCVSKTWAHISAYQAPNLSYALINKLGYFSQGKEGCGERVKPQSQRVEFSSHIFEYCTF